MKIVSRKGAPEYLHALAWSLGSQTDHIKAMEMSLRLLMDPEPSLRGLGIVALAELHDHGIRDAYKALQRAAKDPVAEVRASIPYELRFDSTIETASLLIGMAEDPEAIVRQHVASSLHILALPEAKPCFLRFLKDAEPQVRAAALENSSLWNEDDGVPPFPEAIELQHDQDEDVRANVPSWLRALPDEEGEPLLIRLSRDESPKVRASVLGAYWSLTSQAWILRLIECMEDPSDRVRIHAADHLSRCPDECVAPVLLKHWKDSSATVRKFIAQGLEARADTSMLPIFERLAEDDGNSFTRLATARALGRLRGPESELILSKMLKDPTKLVQKTVRKILMAWAKESPLERATELVLRHGSKGAGATREAFNLTSKRPMNDWNVFLSKAQTLDGLLAGDTDHGPAIVLEKDEATWGLLPFGPANWIRIQCSGRQAEVPSLGYQLLSPEETGDWLESLGPCRIRKGRELAKQAKWNRVKP
jgi:HEAT repeat protein